MKNLFTLCALVILILLSSCASGYKKIEPQSLDYNSLSSTNGISLAYKYGLLNKKYYKKESNNGLRLVALKITNNSDKDIVFDDDVRLSYDDGTIININNNDYVYKLLKQSPTSHLLYLLLAPIKFYTFSTNQYGQQVEKSSFPIGLIVGPGIALGNLITASNANAKFKDDLEQYNIIGKTIKKGETTYGLVGIKSNNFDALKLKMK